MRNERQRANCMTCMTVEIDSKIKITRVGAYEQGGGPLIILGPLSRRQSRGRPDRFRFRLLFTRLLTRQIEKRAFAKKMRALHTRANSRILPSTPLPELPPLLLWQTMQRRLKRRSPRACVTDVCTCAYMYVYALHAMSRTRTRSNGD